MHSFDLGLHMVMVPIILLAAGLALITAISLFFMTRNPAADLEAGTIATFRRIFSILLIVTWGLGILQVLFGAVLFLSGPHPEDQLHYVYGGIVLLAIPVAYVYSDQKQVRRDIIIMGIAVILVIGAAIRALVTGQP